MFVMYPCVCVKLAPAGQAAKRTPTQRTVAALHFREVLHDLPRSRSRDLMLAAYRHIFVVFSQ